MALATFGIVEPDLGGSTFGGAPNFYSGRHVVEHGANRYAFFKDKNNDLSYRKSTNRGKSWGALTVIHAATYSNVSIWFDQWTPGDAGTIVHLFAVDDGADNVNYFTLDISSDTVGNSGSPIVVFDGASTGIAGQIIVSGTKARGGNLYCLFNIDGGTETGFARSTDSGASFGPRTDANEPTTFDQYQLFPGGDADNQDIWCLFWDVSASELSLKVYDDSGNSWSETSISGSMTAVATSTVVPQFYGTVRASDNHLLAAAWNSRDAGTADLKTWDITNAGTITGKTDVVTNSDDCQCVILTLDPDAHVHATYIGKSDGSETVSTAVKIYRKSSIDGMATWSTEYAVFDDFLGSIASIHGGLKSVGRWPLVAWVDDTVFGGSIDLLCCAYLPGSSRPQSLIGV